MRKEIPLAITLITGIVIIVGLFVPHAPFGEIQQRFLSWYVIIAGFTLILGLDSLILVHSRKIRRKEEGYGYSIVLIVSLVFTLGLGVHSIIKYGSAFNAKAPFMKLYMHTMLPLSATMFSLLAFFIASAAYRAFRARNVEATLLLIAGILVMLGRVPLGSMISSQMPIIAEWIMNIPQMAAKRALFIGVGLGSIAMSLRIILGIERTYLR